MPELARGHVLVRVAATMISPGTQLGTARRARTEGPPADSDGKPKRLGYQGSGTVAALGENVTQFESGDRVACFGAAAAHADWIVVPQNLCAKLPEQMSFAEASCPNLVLTALHALRRAEPMFGENTLVVGMGVVGQLAAQFAQLAGTETMVWDTVAGRLRIAERWGVHRAVNVKADDVAAAVSEFTHGFGFDTAVMAIGGDGNPALEQVRHAMKVSPDRHQMGRLIMVGGLSTQMSWGAGMGNLDVRSASRAGPGYHDKAWEVGDREYPPVFVRWTARSNLELGLRWIAQGRLKVEPLITHRLPLERMEEAVDLLIDQPDEAMGVVLTTSDAE